MLLFYVAVNMSRFSFQSTKTGGTQSWVKFCWAGFRFSLSRISRWWLKAKASWINDNKVHVVRETGTSYAPARLKKTVGVNLVHVGPEWLEKCGSNQWSLGMTSFKGLCCLSAVLCEVMTEMLALAAYLWGGSLTAIAVCHMNENKGVSSPALIII